MLVNNVSVSLNSSLDGLVLRLAHHHLAELVEVHGAGPVLVQLGDDAVQLLVSERGEQLGDEAPECVHRDETLAVLVINPEGVLQLPLQGVDVGVLHQELGAELAELTELDLAGAVLVDLGQDVHQLLLAGPEPHGSQDLVQVVGGQEVLLLGVEQVETVLQAFDLVRLKCWNGTKYLNI